MKRTDLLTLRACLWAGRCWAAAKSAPREGSFGDVSVGEVGAGDDEAVEKWVVRSASWARRRGSWDERALLCATD